MAPARARRDRGSPRRLARGEVPRGVDEAGARARGTRPPCRRARPRFREASGAERDGPGSRDRVLAGHARRIRVRRRRARRGRRAGCRLRDLGLHSERSGSHRDHRHRGVAGAVRRPHDLGRATGAAAGRSPRDHGDRGHPGARGVHGARPAEYRPADRDDHVRSPRRLGRAGDGARLRSRRSRCGGRGDQVGARSCHEACRGGAPPPPPGADSSQGPREDDTRV